MYTRNMPHRIKLVLLLTAPLILMSCAAWQKAEPTVHNLLETCDTGQQVCAEVGGGQVCADPVELARLLVEYADTLAAKEADPNPVYIDGDTTRVEPEPEPSPPEPAPELPAVQ